MSNVKCQMSNVKVSKCQSVFHQSAPQSQKPKAKSRSLSLSLSLSLWRHSQRQYFIDKLILKKQCTVADCLFQYAAERECNLRFPSKPFSSFLKASTIHQSSILSTVAHSQWASTISVYRSIFTYSLTLLTATPIVILNLYIFHTKQKTKKQKSQKVVRSFIVFPLPESFPLTHPPTHPLSSPHSLHSHS